MPQTDIKQGFFYKWRKLDQLQKKIQLQELQSWSALRKFQHL